MLTTGIIVLLALLTIVISWRVTREYVSPMTVVATAWGGSLAAYSLYLVPYPRMGARTALFLVVSLICLLGGAFLGHAWGARFNPGRLFARTVAAPEAWINAFAVVGLCGTLWYVWNVWDILGPAAFYEGITIRHALSDRTIPSTFLFLEYFCLIAPILAFAVLLSGTRLRPSALLLPAACALATWITTDRTQFFVLVLTGLFLYTARIGPTPRLATLSRAGVVAVALLVTNFLVVGAWQGKTPENLGVDMTFGSAAPSPEPTHPPEGPQPDAGPGRLDAVYTAAEGLLQKTSTLYLYSTASYAALDWLVENGTERTWGAHSAFPVLRFLQKVGVIDTPLPSAIAPFVPVAIRRGDQVLTFNAYTFLYYPFADFGSVGAFVYALLVGILSGVAFRQVQEHRDWPALLLVNAHVCMALSLSIFVNKFNSTATWYIAAFTLLPFVVSKLQQSRARPALGT